MIPEIVFIKSFITVFYIIVALCIISVSLLHSSKKNNIKEVSIVIFLSLVWPVVLAVLGAQKFIDYLVGVRE